MTDASVSVLIPFSNSECLDIETVISILSQRQTLELIISDYGSTHFDFTTFKALAVQGQRVRVISCRDQCISDALNKAFISARGSFIALFMPGDFYTSGSLERAISSLDANPHWLMVYGEAEVFNEESGLSRRFSTLPSSFGLDGFRSNCFISRPTVVFRRSMGVLLGDFDGQWPHTFDIDYWLRAFKAFPHRIGYIPYLQARSRFHQDPATRLLSEQVALETTKLMAHSFGEATATVLKNYIHEWQFDFPEIENLVSHVHDLLVRAQPWLSSTALAQLENCCLVDNSFQHLQNATLTLAPTHHQTSKKPITPFENRPFGVNLIGHAFEVFGVGEDIRMAAQALQSVGVPCCVLHHPAKNGSACIDRSLEHLICCEPQGGPYAFNLVCMTAPTQARWLREGGFDPLRERYTISSWPWETQRWPEALSPMLNVADELWPSSHFTAKALSDPAVEADRPLRVMPMSAEITQPHRFCSPNYRSSTRLRHGLPVEKVVFGYGFDLNSTAIRKNPMATLEVFQKAFPLPHLFSTFGQESNVHPLSKDVALMIKTLPFQRFSAEWHWLQERAAEDSRIVLLANSLTREEVLALYGCCDVFLSLHRSEGFGRGIAEALQLGVDVIATDYGGNTDFCTGPLAHPVRWRHAPIPSGAYPYADGHSWAEPDLENAAELCRQVAIRRHAIAANSEAGDPSRDETVLAEYRKRFSFDLAGARYHKRLEELWAQRETTAARLLWRKN